MAEENVESRTHTYRKTKKAPYSRARFAMKRLFFLGKPGEKRLALRTRAPHYKTLD